MGVLSKSLSLAMHLWLDLPSWNMRAASGQLATLSFGIGEYWNREDYLFIRKSLVDELLGCGLALAWMVSGNVSIMETVMA